ncbi:MAG: helix-turn-helix transcriptional regulator [Deltaproteobacteria bacterium]|nr:helix-turn-helix transcriptional regulator [Deltaproteobacteria bacterium]MBK8713832.1 helix-turn-helix transcriptional regulator [Deltaproteobacteria bacterium]MBP7291327.1 helix-turn-helix transcriptional regulator [Nannocystaceae bacterium]
MFGVDDIVRVAAANIGSAIESLERSIASIAAEAACSRAYLHALLASRHAMRTDTLARIALAVERTPAQLLTARPALGVSDVAPPTCATPTAAERYERYPLERWVAIHFMRLRAGRSPLEIAADLGWHRSSLSALLNARRSIATDRLAALAATLGSTAAELVSDPRQLRYRRVPACRRTPSA